MVTPILNAMVRKMSKETSSWGNEGRANPDEDRFQELRKRLPGLTKSVAADPVEALYVDILSSICRQHLQSLDQQGGQDRLA